MRAAPVQCSQFIPIFKCLAPHGKSLTVSSKLMSFAFAMKTSFLLFAETQTRPNRPSTMVL